MKETTGLNRGGVKIHNGATLPNQPLGTAMCVMCIMYVMYVCKYVYACSVMRCPAGCAALCRAVRSTGDHAPSKGKQHKIVVSMLVSLKRWLPCWFPRGAPENGGYHVGFPSRKARTTVASTLDFQRETPHEISVET